ncbi:MAG: flagellar M-ring protein FliF [Clostridiales bacterium]|nr:flagellar M-ring protein FliF [Clostridiales bacterium]
MADRLKKLQVQIKEYWAKFEKKQQRMIVSIAAVILIAFAVLGWAVSRPNYETLISTTSTSDAADVKKLLDEEEIPYKMSDNSLIFSVNKEDIASTTLLLAENKIPSTGYDYESLFANNGFSVTESDKKRKDKILLESTIANTLGVNEYIKNAWATLSIPEKSYSVLSSDEETTASVTVELRDELPIGAGESLAKIVAYMVGNKTTNSIIIIDTNANVIFAGNADTTSAVGNISNQLDAATQLESNLKSELRSLILGMNLYDMVEVAPNLVVDFDKTNTTSITYDVADDRKEGYYSESYVSQSEGSNGSGGQPGTALNDMDNTTTYEINNNNSSSTVTVEQYAYLVDQVVEETEGAVGNIKLAESSLALSLTSYTVYNEVDLELQGALDDISFDEFKIANSEKLKTEVDPDLITAVSKATGIREENISVLAYEVPFFQASTATGFQLSNYLQLIVLALIVGLLAFVVYRSTRPVEITEMEPELSVEALLSATKAQPLENIDLQDKSEARKAIERFVDENPEAVALLLRNWLDSGWE